MNSGLPLQEESAPNHSISALSEAPSALRTANTTVIDVEAQPGSEKKRFALPFDPLRLIDAVYAGRWLALVAGMAVAALLGTTGWMRFESHHIANAQLIKQAPGNSIRQSEGGDAYQAHEMTIPTLVALMRSGTVFENATKRLDGKLSEGELRGGLSITPERNTDIVRVSMNSDRNASTALDALQAYVDEVINITCEIQKREAAEMNRMLQDQIIRTDNDVTKLNEEFLEYSKREQLVDPDKQIDAWLGELANYSLKYETTRLDFETLDLQISSIEKELSKVSPVAARLQTARQDLTQLQLHYTNEHPTVIDALAVVKSLESSLQTEAPSVDSPPKPGESTVAESLYLNLVKLRSEKQVLGEQLGKLSAVRNGLNDRLAQLPRKSMELARIRSRKQSLETSRGLLAARQREAALSEENAQGSLRVLSMARPQDVVVESPAKKVALVASGGFFAAAGCVSLVFAAKAAADRRLVTLGDLKRVTELQSYGILPEQSENGSATARDWAFRTWTNIHPSMMLHPTTRSTVCGFLTDEPTLLPEWLGQAAAMRGSSVLVISRRGGNFAGTLAQGIGQPEVVLQMLAHQPGSIVRLQEEDAWQWSIEHREQWMHALYLWCHCRDTVVLLELSHPDQAETLLVAEQLPNLICVGASKSGTHAMKRRMDMYRTSGCRMIGAVLDKAPKFRLALLNKFAAAAAFLLLSMTGFASAESVTLGPGDMVNVSFAGKPELARNSVIVGPDGRLTYLQAQDVQAAGLTIDELRTRLNEELRRYYQKPLVIVTPNSFQSRKVYVLGKVVKKGAINLDRPMTLLEVVAEAGGLETGVFQQNTVELADLGRSFLMRGGSRVEVNMEALFMHGDMTQNVTVQSGDYLYFPSANSNEIYVLGNVKMQGTQGLLAHTSVHSAITQAGGFSPKAYTRRILVIRGSLEKPEAISVNLDDILHGRAKGFRLEPKDIVYVADKPWARAEELLSFAVNAFLQGAVSGWAGANIGPFINEAVLPSR